MSTDETDLDQNVIFDVLSSSRRRYVLYYLSRQEGPVELPDLAKEVAAWEMETAVEDLSPQERKRVYVSLYQTHVPKLDEVGLVEYDQDTGEVRLTPRSRQIEGFLRESPTTRERFVNVAVVLGASLVVLVAGVLLFPAVTSPLQLTGLLVGWTAFVLGVTYLVFRRGEDGRFPRTLRDR